MIHRIVGLVGCLFILLPVAAHSAPIGPDALTPDGGRYYGALRDGKLHGRGKLEWNNGAVYEGEFANGQASGVGIMRFANGTLYEGEFRDGTMSGHGRMREVDGSVYVGEFVNDFYHGRGHLQMSDGAVYEGTFSQGKFSGEGEITYGDGRKYRGNFLRGLYQGQGRLEEANGEAYEGNFDKDGFNGSGTYSRPDGSRYEGGFLKWRFHGAGKYDDGQGTVYEGNFVNGALEGAGRSESKIGARYEGEFQKWRPHGRGTLRLPNGDVYEGEFQYGMYEGAGTLTYAKPRPDGKTKEQGSWRYGSLLNDAEQRQAKVNVELALYNQRKLLDRTLLSLRSRHPGKINLYLLAVAGDGSQEVFRREVQYVNEFFAERFATKGRSIALINSRNTVTSAPMATVTSIRESLAAIAAKMDKQKDILFVYLTSHGSKEHELTLNQNNMGLRNLPARELAELLRETGIGWKVVVVSACYSGGFVDSLQDDNTLVIAAARRDRKSFGCADENDFTYFGRAFFKESLPQSSSFQDAFRRTEALVTDWESKQPADKKRNADGLSLPQMASAKPIEQHLARWWRQLPTSTR